MLSCSVSFIFSVMSSTPNQDNPSKEAPKEAPKSQSSTVKLNHTPAASDDQTGILRFSEGANRGVNFSKDKTSD